MLVRLAFCGIKKKVANDCICKENVCAISFSVEISLILGHSCKTVLIRAETTNRLLK